MGIYIKGIEMPIFEHQSWDIRKGTDGKWYMVDTNAETSDGAWHEIVPVPPHGRLIDADYQKRTLCAECTLYPDKCLENTGDGCDWHSIAHLRMCPTIIPAEEGET